MARGRKKKNGAAPASNGADDIGPQPLNADGFQEILEELTAAESDWQDLHEEAKSAKSKVDAIKKRFKKAGGNLDELADARRLLKMGEDDANAHLAGVLKYARWMGQPLGAQASIFDIVDEPPLTQKQADKATFILQEETGEIRGQAGDVASDNPHLAGSIEFVAWERGRKKGFAQFTAKQAGEKPNKARRGRPAAIPRVAENLTGSPLN